jgi:hypothetical protein
MPQAQYVGVIEAALDIISTRVLALLAELGAIGMWSYTVFDPTTVRTWAALGYSATVLVPMVLLHWRKG